MIDQETAGLAVGLLAVLIFFYGVKGWVSAVRRRLLGLPLLAVSYTSPPPVTLFDLLALFIAQVAAEFWAVSLAGIKGPVSLADLPDSKQLSLLFFLNVARLSVFLIATALLYLRYRGSCSKPSIATWLRDVRTGAFAFCMIAPFVYGMQLVLSLIWKPSQHSIIGILRDANDRWAALAVCGIAAVIAAPLFEELLFRRMLHGWLDRLASSKPDDRLALLFATGPRIEASVEPRPADAATSAVEEPEMPASDAVLNPYASFEKVVDSSEESEDSSATTVDSSGESRPKIPFWPLLASSAVFALMHFGNGPDPIPLFFFALWLAYLYRLTGRITPCIVVHLFLNLFSFSLLAIEVLFN